MRKEVQSDDVVDALAALVTAAAPSELVERLQGRPALDLAGLPMEMLYVGSRAIRSIAPTRSN
jgi:predicted RNase H-like nuclease